MYRSNRVRRAALTFTIFAALLSPAAALAQAYQCTVPSSPVAARTPQADGPTRQIPVSGYTLALSWSPQYCRSRAGSRADQRQCSGKTGRFGFVVHGLWPDGNGASWPQWCPTSRRLTSRELTRNLCMSPSARMLAQEWAKHGSCMSHRPESYFKITRILWNSLRWPDFDRLSHRQGLTAGDLRAAFARANPHWEEEHIGLKLNRRGWLQEMRLCYGRDFMPTRCDRQHFGPANRTPVKVWRGL